MMQQFKPPSLVATQVTLCVISTAIKTKTSCVLIGIHFFLLEERQLIDKFTG